MNLPRANKWTLFQGKRGLWNNPPLMRVIPFLVHGDLPPLCVPTLILLFLLNSQAFRTLLADPFGPLCLGFVPDLIFGSPGGSEALGAG